MSVPALAVSGAVIPLPGFVERAAASLVPGGLDRLEERSASSTTVLVRRDVTLTVAERDARSAAAVQSPDPAPATVSRAEVPAKRAPRKVEKSAPRGGSSFDSAPAPAPPSDDGAQRAPAGPPAEAAGKDSEAGVAGETSEPNQDSSGADRPREPAAVTPSGGGQAEPAATGPPPEEPVGSNDAIVPTDPTVDSGAPSGQEEPARGNGNGNAGSKSNAGGNATPAGNGAPDGNGNAGSGGGGSSSGTGAGGQGNGGGGQGSVRKDALPVTADPSQGSP